MLNSTQISEQLEFSIAWPQNCEIFISFVLLLVSFHNFAQTPMVRCHHSVPRSNFIPPVYLYQSLYRDPSNRACRVFRFADKLEVLFAPINIIVSIAVPVLHGLGIHCTDVKLNR